MNLSEKKQALQIWEVYKEIISQTNVNSLLSRQIWDIENQRADALDIVVF